MEMDLSGLRQSLQRLALLEGGGGGNGEAETANDFNVAGQPPDGSSKTAGCPVDGKSTTSARPLPPPPGRASGRRERAKGDTIRSTLKGSRGGGIRVYEDEEDEWDLPPSQLGRWESSGYRNINSKRTPLMRLRVLMNGVSALLCVSMGSNVNVLKPEIAKRARLSLTKVEPSLWVSLDTGGGHGPGMPVEYLASSAPYQIDDFFAQDDFYVMPELTCHYLDGIVGIDWLEKYKPTVNYRLNRIELIDLRGRVHVIESVPGSERAGRGENESQWISARVWDWDTKKILRGHYLTEFDNDP